MLQIKHIYTDGKSRSNMMRDLIDGNAEIQGLGFKHIELLSYKEALELDKMKMLADIMWNRPKGEFDEHEWLISIEDTIESEWEPTRFNLMFHSSGYDSRVISHFLRKSYKKRPGPMLFVCMAPETIDEIMKYQGWDESQWTSYNICANPFNLMFDFNTAWKGFDGLGIWPVNVFTTCIEYLQILKKIPTDLSRITVWTGNHMNELFGSAQSLGLAFRKRYCHKSATLVAVNCPVTVAPILSVRSLRAIFSKLRMRYFKDRNYLLTMLDPKLAKFKRQNPFRGCRIPPEVAHRMRDDFKSSYYFRFINQIPIPELIHSHSGNKEFWKVWTFASLVEHLTRQGVKII